MSSSLQWVEALGVLPNWWNDNGCSSPFRFFHSRLYSDRILESIAIAARMHDGGFGPLRLPGSGFEQFRRVQWNLAYRRALIDMNHPVVAEVHHSGLFLGSARPWQASMKEMHAVGWHTYEDFLSSEIGPVMLYRMKMQLAWKG